MSPVPAPSDLPVELRTEALESILVEKGLVDPAVLDKFIKTYAEDRSGVQGPPAGGRHGGDRRARLQGPAG
jgi:hypothetical protein